MKRSVNCLVKLNLKKTKNRYDIKTKSAEPKTQRSEFRVKITPSKLNNKKTELNIAFFKREVASSLNEY